MASWWYSVVERWRIWRHRRATAKRRSRLKLRMLDTELREFVYLDSMSVHSLLASRLGPIATEQTDSEARTWERKASGRVGIDLAEFDVRTSGETSRGGSQSVQVLKKSIIQTTFKRLWDLERENLLLDARPAVEGAGSVPAEEVTRGRLVELEVELDVRERAAAAMGPEKSSEGEDPTEPMNYLDCEIVAIYW